MGLLRDIPVEKVRKFEEEFLENLRTNQPEMLAKIAMGEFTDEFTVAITSVAKEVSQQFVK